MLNAVFKLLLMLKPLLRLRLWFLGLLVWAIASLSCWAGSASAAETIILNYLDTRIPVSNHDFVAFASGTAISKDLQTFFERIPLTPDSARDLLNETILPRISLTVDNNLNHFLAFELNKLMGEPYGRESLDALEKVVRRC